jgi:L-arabinokinase
LLAVYVSGHGFGHATRTAEVLRAVRAAAPDRPLGIVTTAPERLFGLAIPGPFLFRIVECDVGLAQKDALVIDEDATAERYRRFAADLSARVAREAEWLRSAGARLVLGDVPPLAFEAAAAAGLPSVALGNFSWDWVYRHYAGRQPALATAADDAAAAYRKATLLLELPFTCDMSVFARREAIPLVARRGRIAPHEVRRRLELPGSPVVLLSFGGLGLAGFDPQVLSGLREYFFVMADEVGHDRLPANARMIGAEALGAAGLAYPELIGAADVVVTKPGYGIVADAIAARARMVFTDRGDFPEYPILVREMPRYLACRYAPNDAVMGGRLGDALAEVLAMPLPEPADLGGAEAAARRLLSL